MSKTNGFPPARKKRIIDIDPEFQDVFGLKLTAAEGWSFRCWSCGSMLVPCVDGYLKCSDSDCSWFIANRAVAAHLVAIGSCCNVEFAMEKVNSVRKLMKDQRQ